MNENITLCAPERVSEEVSCFYIDELEALSKAWNLLNLHDPIRLTTRKDTKEYLWIQLANKLKPVCEGKTESCWLDQQSLLRSLRRVSPDLFDNITKFALKPKGKKGKREWLSTSDIELVMNQYEKKYPRFRFIDCVSSDFYQLYPDKFPMEFINHHDLTAIVFNLDSFHQRGSHWVAVVFSHAPNGTLEIEYFDSTGEKPNRNIKQFLINPLFEGATYTENTVKHQRQNSECGVYSMYYILQRCMGMTMEDVNMRRISDKEMNEYRQELFRPWS